MQNGRGRTKYSAPPARQENYYNSKQTSFSYHLDKAFHLPEFQAQLFFTRNWVGGLRFQEISMPPPRKGSDFLRGRGVNLTNFQVGRVLLTRKRVTKKKHETFKTTIYLRRIRMNEHSEDILSVPWRGSTIGLAGCGIWLFFLLILGMRAENRSGMWAFNNHLMRES